MIPIAYKLLPAQKQFIHIQNPECKLDVCVYQGGYGSGKTFVGSFLGIELSEKYPGNRGLVVAKTYPLVRDTTLQAYFEHFENYGYRLGKDFFWKASESKVMFPNGSEILFRHLDAPYKLKSLNLGWVHMEEMSEMGESSFLMLLSRLRLKKLPRHRLFGTTNPQPNKGWIYRYFVEKNHTDPPKMVQPSQSPSEENLYPPSTIQYRRILAPSTENVHLSPEYLENMKNQFDSDYYRINVLGQDADYTAGLVCKGWGPLNIEDTCYREDLRLYLSCDFNVDPMCWVVFHRFNGEYHFIDEFCLENTTSLEASEAFFKKYGLHESGLVLTGDASGKNRSTQAQSALDTNYTIIRNRLSQLGMRDIHLDLKTKNPPIETRVAAWNALVCNSQGVRRIKVNPQCKWLISNCENLRYLPGTSQIWEPTPRQIETHSNLKFVKHIWDAASYPVEKYDPILREQPKNRNPSRIIPQSFHPRSPS